MNRYLWKIFLFGICLTFSSFLVFAQDSATSITEVFRIAPSWSPDNQSIAIIQGTVLTIQNLQGRVTSVFEEATIQTISAFTWSPDQQYIALGFSNGLVKIYDLTTQELVRTINSNGMFVTALAWSPTRAQIASGADPDGGDGLFIWDLQTGTQVASVATSVASLAYSRNGDYLATGSSSINVWNTETWANVIQFITPNDSNIFVTTMEWNLNNQILASGSMNGAVNVWSIDSSTPILSYPGSPSYERGESRGSIALSYAQLSKTWIRDVNFVDDSDEVVSIAADGTLQRWDVGSNLILVDRQIQPLLAGAWNNSGLSLAVISSIGTDDVSPLGSPIGDQSALNLLQVFEGSP